MFGIFLDTPENRYFLHSEHDLKLTAEISNKRLEKTMRNALLRSFAVRVKGLGICLLVILVFAVGVLAQTQITGGTIQGTVLDANGAALPGANVEVKNVDTNFVRTSTTDEEGRFVALQLPPGRYTVTVSKSGFATLVVEKADLTVGQAMNLPLSMKVSGVEERVTITATPTVDTLKTESSTTLNEKAVSTTPILGRKFEDLLTLTPGVSVVQGPDGDEITFAGQRGVFNNVSLDGGDYNNGFFGEQLGGQRAAIDITLEAVKEFQVVATGASAEFGRTAGGIINVITKSGTNEVHGSVFHFQRLEALAANTSDGKPLKDFRREQFGGTIGGPIKKDKAFFFFAFEGIHENLTRANLSEQLGAAPCPVSAPTIVANEAAINSNSDCQRLALINFIKSSTNQDEGLAGQTSDQKLCVPWQGRLEPQQLKQTGDLLQLRLLEEHESNFRCSNVRQFSQWHRGPVEDQCDQLQSLQHSVGHQSE